MRPLRPAARLLAVTLLASTLVAGVAGAASAAPPTPTFGRAIEPLAAYDPQTKCHPVAQPGVIAFRALFLKAYPGTGDLGIVSACDGTVSEHHEGRAWDWAARVSNARQKAQVEAAFRWLFATDRYGNKYAMARRLGIMYIIWNRHIWGSYAASAGWRPYNGSNPHTTHVHFSFTRAGAAKKTSYWTKVVAPTPAAPTPSPRPTPTPTHSTTPEPPAPLVVMPASLWVNSASDGVTTPYRVVAGRHYLVEARGTYVFAGDRRADSECSQDVESDAATWRRNQYWMQGQQPNTLDLSVGGAAAWVPVYDTGQRCNTKTHAYRMVITPQETGRLHLRVISGDHSQNIGKLQLTVLKTVATDDAPTSIPVSAPVPPAPTPTVQSAVVSSTADGAATPFSLVAGTHYRVEAWGTYQYDAAGSPADPECNASAQSEDGWHRWAGGDQSGRRDGLDLVVAGHSRWTAVVDDGNGCNTVDHHYYLDYTPDRSGPVWLGISDTVRGDDSGSLQVTFTPEVGV